MKKSKRPAANPTKGDDRLSEPTFDAVLECLGDAVIVTDSKGRVRLVNPAAERLTGWRRGEARGRLLSEVAVRIDPKSRLPLPEPALTAIPDGRTDGQPYGVLLISRDGSEHPVAESVAPVRARPGTTLGAVLVFRDQGVERQALEAVRFTHLLLNSSQDPVYCLDPADDFRLIYANDAFVKHLGYPRERILTMTPRDFGPAASLDKLRESRDRRTQEPILFETCHHTADGRAVPVEIQAGIFDYGGKTLVIGSIRDVTELRQAAASLAEGEERYRRLAEKAPDLIYRYELFPERCFSYVSPAASSIVGYTPEEHYANPELGATLVHPDDRSKLEAYFSDPDRLQEPLTLRWIHKDGRVIHTEQRNVSVFDEDGMLIAVEGIARDVTQQVAAEAALRESEARYRGLFLAHPLPMWVYDMETLRFLEVNEAAVQNYGYSRDEFLSMTIRDIRPSEDIPRLEAAVASARDHPGYLQSPGWRHRTQSGRVFEVEIWSHPMVFEGRASEVIVAHDVSERLRLEKQLLQAQKMESIGRLAGGVAHDFNNMLSVILGNVEFALDSELTTELRDQLEEIQTAARRSADLTRHLLAFARRQTVSPKVLDLNETVAGMLKMMRRLMGEDIDLVWMPGAELWPVRMDPAQVDQILANLCVNARDAITGVGRVTIETRNYRLVEVESGLHPSMAAGDYIELVVSDNGCGIPLEIQQHLFEPFFTTKKAGEGTGLGLSTVYGIVRQNKGYIQAASGVGRGTSFSIYLPRYGGGAVSHAECIGEHPRGTG